MKSIFLFILLLLLSISFVPAQQIILFNDGDRIVFLGNSITHGGHYHSYYMTRFPAMRLTIFNAGTGGDRVNEMVKRLDGDVFSKRPIIRIKSVGRYTARPLSLEVRKAWQEFFKTKGLLTSNKTYRRHSSE